MSYEVKDIKEDIVDVSQHTPVVLDFWAEWCGPCRTLGPVIEKLAQKAKGQWKLVKVDLENPNNQSLAAQFQIRSIPAVRMLYQGKLLAQFDGALPEHEIKKWLASNLPENNGNGGEDYEAMLLAAIESGDRKASREAAINCYNEDKESDEMKVNLAMQLLPDELADSRKLIESLGDTEKYLIEHEVVQTVHHLNQVAEGVVVLPDSEPAEEYRLAAQRLFNNEYELAVESFLKVLMTDRSLDEEGARKGCIAIFRMLGDKHPVSMAYRRHFSMALY